MRNFLISIRNMTAALFSWMLLVWMLYYAVLEEQNVALGTLWKLFALSLCWAVLFTVFYSTHLFDLKKLTPTKKFTFFMVLCTLAESLLIYRFGLFGITSLAQWGMFIGLVLLLYTLSLGIFEIYKNRAGKEYTKRLKEYQHAGGNEDVA